MSLPSKGYLPPKPKVSEVDGKLSIKARKSQWAQALLHLNGDRYRLNKLDGDDANLSTEAWDMRGDDPSASEEMAQHLQEFGAGERRDYIYPIFDNPLRKAVLCCGRQVEKSTICSALMVTESTLISMFRTLYVSPSAMQTRTFSSEKLAPLLRYSEMINKYWRDTSCRDQVFEKGFLNGSMIFLRYAFLNADRARGIPADRLLIDELQDILADNIRVIEECLSHSKHAWSLYVGTPKTLENTMERYWGYSTQNEWMIPCDHHTPKKWVKLDVDAIGEEGPICKHCGRPINVTAGQWVQTTKDAAYQGFRIPQLMVPWKLDPQTWKDEIVWKLENYDEGEFHNEVLGISFDNAAKPVTRQELVQCCWPANNLGVDLSRPVMPSKIPPIFKRSRLFMGVDWGEGRAGKGPGGRMKRPSFTVVSIGAMAGDKIAVIYQKRYEGKEADKDYVLKDVGRLMAAYNIKIAAVDRGFGWGINSDLIKTFGESRVVQFQYVRQKESTRWDPLSFCFTIDRNFHMSETINLLKRQGFAFPPWEASEEFLKDVESIYVDYRQGNRNEMYFDHTDPDDAFQSLLLLRCAIYLAYNKLTPAPF